MIKEKQKQGIYFNINNGQRKQLRELADRQTEIGRCS